MAVQQVPKGMTSGFSTLLNANFALLESLIAASEQTLANAVLYLHGEGKQSGCGLFAGSGLWVEVGVDDDEDDIFWVNGRRYVIDAPPLTCTVPENTTSYIYVTLDEDGEPAAEARAEKTLPSGVGEWYAGECTTDLDSVTAVDDSEAESISAESVQQAFLDILEAIEVLQAAVGEDYLSETPPGASIDDRLDALEAGGLENAVLWGALEKAPGDTTTVDQQIDADIQDHVEEYHAGGPGTDPNVEYVITEYDVDAANMGRMALLLCRTVQKALFQYMSDVSWVVWLISGDDTDGYDNVDWVNSTWVVTP